MKLYITDIKSNGCNDVLLLISKEFKLFEDVCKGYFPITSNKDVVLVLDDHNNILKFIDVNDLNLDRFTPLEEININTLLEYINNV